MRFCLVLLMSFCASVPAFAGPNMLGVLAVHDAGLRTSATNGSISLCVQGSSPVSCASVVTEIDGTTASDPALFRLYAIFPQVSSPRLTGLTFGITSSTPTIVAGGMCGDFELPDAGWPAGPYPAGNSVTYPTVQTTHITPVYWFLAYGGGAYTGQVVFGPNPTQGGFFGNDGVIGDLDPIYGYGAMGFDTPGRIACVYVDPTGPCCDRVTGACQVTIGPYCWALGNIWHEGPACTPEACGTGACCLPGWTCQDLTPSACQAAGGTFDGLETACATNEFTDCWAARSGACCTGTACVVTAYAACEPVGLGLWVPDSPCTPNPCAVPLGACCNGVDCTLTTESACNAVWFPGAGCYSPPCGGGMGACCGYWGCTVTDSPHCSGATAVWLANRDCRPYPCTPPVPVEQKSWGQVKQRYR